MTTETGTTKAKTSASSELLGGILGTLGGTALSSWLAGVGLSHGFGVSVPFTATWLVMLGFLLFVKQVALTASQVK